MWLPTPPARLGPIGSRVIYGAFAGLAVALLALLVGLVRAVVVLASGQRVDLTGAIVGLLVYVGAFVVGGALVGLLWPRKDSALRRAFVFVLGMSIVMGAIWTMEEGSPVRWAGWVWLAWVGLSVAFGLALSYGHERG